jgi:hypothetical protein
MRLHLRQVEVRPAVPGEELVSVVVEVQPEVEQRGRDRVPIDGHVPLHQMPPARTHEQRRDRVVERVRLPLGTLERQRAAHRIHEIALTGDDVLPRRRKCVFEIGHEAARAGVEGVDHHLPLDGAGDLDAPILEIPRGRRDAPFALANTGRVSKESW